MRRSVVAALLTAVLAGVVARPASAQAPDNQIDPGMTKAQVIQHLGPPQSSSKKDSSLFLYYKNGCEKTCGMLDLVILVNDKVVDAIFRDPNRHYTGQSSSPMALTPAEARKSTNKSRAPMKVAPDTTTPAKAEVIAAPPAPPVAPPPADTAKAPADSATKTDSSTKTDSAAKPPAA